MELTNEGKVFCYLTAYDNEKNSAGTSDIPYIVIEPEGTWDAWPRRIYVGANGNNAQGIKYQACKNIYIQLYESYSGGARYTDIDWNPLPISFKGSYNYEHDDISYINPIIIHGTMTCYHSGAADSEAITISKVRLVMRMGQYNTASNRWEGGRTETIVEQELETPLVLNPGDSATFTITVK